MIHVRLSRSGWGGMKQIPVALRTNAGMVYDTFWGRREYNLELRC